MRRGESIRRSITVSDQGMSAGYPATVVPVGSWSSGTPKSVQLVGTPGSDHRLLTIARRLEQQLPWTRNHDVAN
jgi:Asp-tRNA(Asn)/Glu-tRNA(Gln) amidotransferase A subunit family amidase